VIRFIAVLAAVTIMGCATSPSPPARPTQPAERAPVMQQPTPPAPAPPAVSAPALTTPGPGTCVAFLRPGVLRKAVVQETVKEGLGRWLSNVDIAPALSGGRFRGWILERFYPGHPCFTDIDLRPGDIVLRINGHGLEQVNQSFTLFSSLASAGQIVVEYVRDRKPLRLVVAIAEE
jgi:hypothetical protein